YWLDRLFEALGKLFPELEMADSSGDVLGVLLIAAAFIVLLVLSFFLFRLLRFERRSLRRQASASEEELESAPASLFARSREAAARGAYREASRLLFLSLLLGLQERE